MITFITTLKSFRDSHSAVIQENAVRSWSKLPIDKEIILLGNDEGTADLAKSLGCVHIQDIEYHESGKPYLNSILYKAEEAASYPIKCLLNGDLILKSDFVSLITFLNSESNFIAYSQRLNLDIIKALNWESNWLQELEEMSQTKGVWHNLTAKDLCLYDGSLLPFNGNYLMGIAAVDDIIFYEAAKTRKSIDCTAISSPYHQNHHYIFGDKKLNLTQAYQHPVSQHNRNFFEACVPHGKGFSLRECKYFLSKSSNGEIMLTDKDDMSGDRMALYEVLAKSSKTSDFTLFNRNFASVKTEYAKSKPQVSVIFSNPELKHELPSSCQSLIASTDYSSGFDKQVFLNINLGRLNAWNIAAAFADAEYILFCDTKITNNRIGELTELLKTKPLCVSVGSCFNDKIFCVSKEAFLKAGGWNTKYIGKSAALELCRKLANINSDLNKQILIETDFNYEESSELTFDCDLPEIQDLKIFETRLYGTKGQYSWAGCQNITEAVLIEERVNNILKVLSGRVALMGAGQHTHWLLQALSSTDTIEGIIDDNPNCSHIAGITVYQTANCPKVFSHVILSSDVQNVQASMKKQIEKFFPDAEIVNLYEGLPFGPYHKRSVL